jgi:hypothetical protein
MKGWMDSYDFNSHDRFLPIILIGTQGRCNHRTTRQLAVSTNCMCVCSNCSRHEHAVVVKSNPPCQACCGPKTVSDHIMFGCPVARALWSAIGVTLHPDTLVRPHDDELSAVQPPRPDVRYGQVVVCATQDTTSHHAQPHSHRGGRATLVLGGARWTTAGSGWSGNKGARKRYTSATGRLNQ